MSPSAGRAAPPHLPALPGAATPRQPPAGSPVRTQTMTAVPLPAQGGVQVGPGHPTGCGVPVGAPKPEAREWVLPQLPGTSSGC